MTGEEVLAARSGSRGSGMAAAVAPNIRAERPSERRGRRHQRNDTPMLRVFRGPGQNWGGWAVWFCEEESGTRRNKKKVFLVPNKAARAMFQYASR
ncbi:hypothetical protein E2562_024259 [Oryza meyeriana var. granulata]|uniref:Uncharacterized protein n=1 Tax=Oryza meyeriana var. granulata TaxID=110450 RepID=A0A6G1E044_9ORYZ|nr:hypothetical protein E2562_024259 [Oryza meyeriana var. granulata]